MDYFGSDKMSVTGFGNFCRKNIPLIIAVTFTLFFIYGIKLFDYTIGADTDKFMASGRFFPVTDSSVQRWIQNGRFGLILLQKLWYIREFNPYTAFFVTCCFIWLFVISWCYLIAVFNKNTGKDNKLIPFALLFMTAIVWVEQFHWILQSAEMAFIVCLCPYVIYFLFVGVFQNNRWKIILAGALIVLMTSVYQAMVPLFVCGVLACFLLVLRYSNYEKRVYRSLFIKLGITFLLAVNVYFLLNELIVRVIFHGQHEFENLAYSLWTGRTFKQNILAILGYCYEITIGSLPMINALIEPYIIKNAPMGAAAANTIFLRSFLLGNVLLLPITLLFLYKIKLRRSLFTLVGFAIPMCILVLPIVRAGSDNVRTQFVLPFATAFMLWYLISTYKKIPAIILAILAIVVSVRQAEVGAQLYYSDNIRYQQDVALAQELDKRILSIQDESDKLPVVLIGAYRQPFIRNQIFGELLGISSFCYYSCDPYESSKHGFAFMKSLGINYELPSKQQMKIARAVSDSMPSYPAAGSVQRVNNMIVVKFSESTYKQYE